MIAVLFCLSLAQSTFFHSLYPFPDGSLVLHKSQSLSPIILVPGLMSSRLDYARKGSSEWRPLWFSLDSFLPQHITKWAKYFALDYDAEKDLYSSNSQITVRPHDFGGVDVCFVVLLSCNSYSFIVKGVTYLDPKFKSATACFDGIVDALIEKGYTVGVNLFAAPVSLSFLLALFHSYSFILFSFLHTLIYS